MSTLDENRDDAIETTGSWPDGLDFNFPVASWATADRCLGS
jgi:hypothetical protein